MSIDSPVAIAEDAAGELYVVDIGGEIFKIVATGVPITTTTSTSSTTSTTATTLASPCGPAPATGCHTALPAKSSILLKDQIDDTKDRLRWSITRGSATGFSEFHDPVSGSPVYHVCIYDGSARPQPLLDLRVAAGGICGSKPCWKTRGHAPGDFDGNGFTYSDAAASHDGVRMMKLVSGASGAARIQVRGNGPLLGMPALALGLPAGAQLVSTDGATTECWQTTFPAALRNDVTRFKASGP